MKKLPRRILRDEDKPGYSRALWQPSWKCFCCRDRGIVSAHLAAMVIEEFDHRIDEIPYCQNPGCDAGSHLLANELIAKVLDLRLNAAICQELDLIERKSWKQMLHQQHSYEAARSGDGRAASHNSSREFEKLVMNCPIGHNCPTQNGSV